MVNAVVIRPASVPAFKRGDGVETRLLASVKVMESVPVTSGLTRFPPGCSAPMHSHNCVEQVTLISGRGEVECGGDRTVLSPPDTTIIPAGEPHRFVNTGEEDLVILWVYGSDQVTRTFTATGETVAHLSANDLVNE